MQNFKSGIKILGQLPKDKYFIQSKGSKIYHLEKKITI